MKRTVVLLSTLLIASFGGSVLANAEHHPAAEKAAGTKADQVLSEGQVRKVDKETGKLTIKHGPLVNLDMPAMTMVFRVQNPAMLDEVKVGDAIRFKAEQVDGNLTVTQLQPAR